MNKQTLNKPLFAILLVNFIGTLGFSIVLPFLVFVVTRFGGNAMIYGIMGSVYPAFQLIGAPILGRWSDIYGRKKILFLSQAGTVIGWLIFLAVFFTPVTNVAEVNSELLGVFTLTVPLIIIFTSRAVDGLTGGNISIANAYLSDITTDDDRNKNFGKMTVSSNLGFIAGPAISGLLGSTPYGEIVPVLAAVILSVITAAIIFYYLPDSRPKSYCDEPADIKKVLGMENKECFKAGKETKIGLGDVFKLPHIPFILILYFLIFLSFNFFYTAFPVHASVKLNWSITEVGIFYSVLSLIMVFVQGPVLTRVSKKVSESKLIISGNLLLAVNFVLLLSPDYYVIYLAAVFFAFGNGLMWPSVLSILSKAAGKKYQGSVQGFASSAGSLASIAGLIAGGLLYANFKEMTFLFSSATIFLVFILSFRLLKTQVYCEYKAAMDTA